MRLKTSTLKDPKHSELVSCVTWISPDDVLSIGDDGKVLKWNLVNAETRELAELASDFHPTDIHWFPRASIGPSTGGPNQGKGPKKATPTPAANAGGANDVFLVTSAEGKLQLMSGKNGRIEKSVEAHRGACLCAR